MSRQTLQSVGRAAVFEQLTVGLDEFSLQDLQILSIASRKITAHQITHRALRLLFC